MVQLTTVTCHQTPAPSVFAPTCEASTASRKRVRDDRMRCTRMTTMNGIDSYIHGEDDPAISEAIRSGHFVHISGQVSKTPDGEFVHGDFQTQASHVFANIDRILTHFGATKRQ